MFQTTIKNPVSCYGIGVHSGRNVQLTMKPAKAGTGIVFVRTDVTQTSDNFIEANFLNVSETSYSTSISNNDSKVFVSTIEHLMAAIWGCNIDNMIIEIDGPEVPIMDGSSKPFLFMLEFAGAKDLPQKKKILKINKEVIFTAGDSESIIMPSDNFRIDLEIEFKSKAIGRQEISYSDRSKFSDEVASARTFGFVHELEYMKSKGLARGASLSNAIGLDNDIILNHDGLRYRDEFVRHKLLDAIGDFSLASSNILGAFKCIKPGHALNNNLLRKVFDNPSNYSWEE